MGLGVSCTRATHFTPRAADEAGEHTIPAMAGRLPVPPPILPGFRAPARAVIANQRSIRRPKPTPELQALYAKFRGAQEAAGYEVQYDHQDFEDGLQRLAVPSGDDQAGSSSEPLSPSVTSAPGMSRSASGRSASARSATQSVTDALGGLAIGAHCVQKHARQKARRHGPLDKVTKARAALHRKVGACEVCRDRKVTVSETLVCSSQLYLG